MWAYKEQVSPSKAFPGEQTTRSTEQFGWLIVVISGNTEYYDDGNGADDIGKEHEIIKCI